MEIETPIYRSMAYTLRNTMVCSNACLIYMQPISKKYYLNKYIKLNSLFLCLLERANIRN